MEDEMETVITQGTIRMKITQVVNGYGLHIRDSIKVFDQNTRGTPMSTVQGLSLWLILTVANMKIYGGM